MDVAYPVTVAAGSDRAGRAEEWSLIWRTITCERAGGVSFGGVRGKRAVREAGGASALVWWTW